MKQNKKLITISMGIFILLCIILLYTNSFGQTTSASTAIPTNVPNTPVATPISTNNNPNNPNLGWIITIALILEKLTEMFVGTFDQTTNDKATYERKRNVFICNSFIGFLTSLLLNLNIFTAIGLTNVNNESIGIKILISAFTGAAIGAGSQFIHDLTAREKKQSP